MRRSYSKEVKQISEMNEVPEELTQMLFFTAYAVYILVIDISEDLDAPLEIAKDDTL
ncbi:unnamed protein product, partial [Medioppia subpectinata]